MSDWFDTAHFVKRPARLRVDVLALYIAIASGLVVGPTAMAYIITGEMPYIYAFAHQGW